MLVFAGLFPLRLKPSSYPHSHCTWRRRKPGCNTHGHLPQNVFRSGFSHRNVSDAMRAENDPHSTENNSALTMMSAFIKRADDQSSAAQHWENTPIRPFRLQDIDEQNRAVANSEFCERITTRPTRLAPIIACPTQDPPCLRAFDACSIAAGGQGSICQNDFNQNDFNQPSPRCGEANAGAASIPSDNESTSCLTNRLS